MILSVKSDKTSTSRHTLRGMRMRLAALLLILVSLLGAAFLVIHQLTPTRAATGDWPMYLHDYSRDGSGTDTIISPSNASQLALDWSFNIGAPIDSAATVVGNTVYVGGWDGNEYSLNATTGALIWKTFLGQTNAPCYPQVTGVSSTAAIDNGVLYVGGGDTNFYALDASTGAVLWKTFMGDNTKGWYNWSSPVIYNGYAYIGTASVGDCPLIPGQLLQISLSTHLVTNSYNTVPPGQVGGGIWTSPSVDPATNTIFVAIGNLTPTADIVALDANSLALKSSWVVPESDAAAAGGDADFGTSSMLFTDQNGDQLLEAINKNGIAYAFNRNNLAAGPIWKQQIAVGGTCPECGDGSVSSAAFGNNTLFMAGGNAVINNQGYTGSVNALDPATGTYLWQHATSGMVISPLAYSNGLVVAGAGPTLEVLDASNGSPLWSYTTGAQLYAEPTVANGQIFEGSTDGTLYAFSLGTPTTPPADPNCPTGWVCQDIGSPSPAGAESVSAGTWNVSSGGTGVGGGSDQFRFESQIVNGDVQISAQITSQQLTAGTAQAGLLIRQSNDPTAPYYAVFAEPNNKVVVQYRKAFDSAPTTVTLSNAPALPLSLEIQRSGDQFQAALSTDGVNYTLIPGDTATIPLPSAVMVGLAVSSGTAGTANTVTYNAVSIQPPGAAPNPPASASACPSGWSCADVGNPSTVGDQTLSAGVWTVKGAGAGIQYAADQFHFVWQQLAGDGSISAHITTQQNTSASALAGVMLRQGTAGNAAYYGAFITPGSGVSIQYRPTAGLRTQQISGPASTVPTYLMIAGSAGTYCTYSSSDGTNWSYVIGSCVALGLSGPLLAGLAVTSASGATLGVDTFDTVTLSTTAPPPPSNCPTGWNCADVGYSTPAGSQSLSNGTWTVLGGGADIYGTYDQFRYVWQQLTGDGVVSAHITSQANDNIWAKAGVMIRQTTDPGAMYYAALVTPGNGIVVQYRSAQGGGAQQIAKITTGAVPAYLMVTRSGNVFSAYTSSDGTTWSLITGSSVTIAMIGAVQAGMAVSSHDASFLDTVTFDTVTISASLLCPAGWSCADIGNPTPAGTQSESNGTWTVQAGGADIYGTSDQFHYIWQSLAADGSVSAQVTSQTNTSSNAKAGVMLRLSSDPGSPFYDAVVTPGHGVAVQYRKNQGGSAQQSTNLTALTVPIYLMVARAGVTFSAYTSSDDVNWTLVPGSSVTLPNMTGTLLAGIAATSHSTTKLSAVMFSSVTISTCPLNWNCADIGSPVPSGGQSESNGTWTITAGGNDIWGVSDTFHYVWQPLSGDGVVNAQVLTQSSSSTWAKAGVMIRQSTDPGAMYYAALVTPGNGIVVQYRSAQGGNTSQVKISGTVPTYLLVQRVGTTFSAYTSPDGSTWTLVPGSSVTITMTGSVLAGLAATSHNSNALGTVSFGNVNVSAGSLPMNCPTGWSCADIGNPTLAGSQSVNGSTWTVQAAGTDIFGTSDQFHYSWQTLSANGSVAARVVSQTNSSGWAKAGVMLRQDSTASAAYYSAYLTPGNGVVIQYRKAAGAGAQTLVTFSGTAPAYLAVARSGTTFTAYTSTDGVVWTLVTGSSVTITMTGPVLAGLAVTSHNAAVLGAVTFDNVNVGTTVP